MRDITTWKLRLTRELKKHWDENMVLDPGTVCDIELGITIHHNLLRGQPLENLWVMLTGYPFPIIQEHSWSDDQILMYGTARHLLPYYRSPFPWKRALQKYRQLPEYVRLYDIDVHGHSSLKDVAVASDRFDYYEATLLETPNHRKLAINWAASGTYEYITNNRVHTAEIPDELVFSPPDEKHSLANRSVHEDITLTWMNLIENSNWMDARLKERGFEDEAKWNVRLSRVRLQLFNQKEVLSDTQVITIKGMMNLIGMVSSGKTTLMTVLAVWAARNGYHITLVVGDVISALQKAQLFEKLGLESAPILGSSNRERHTNRLHRVVRTESPDTPLIQAHKGFDWLSTSCSLGDLTRPTNIVKLHERPCLNLQEVVVNADEESTKPSKVSACPIFTKCTFHQAQHDLVSAQIWIATPASLVYTGIAPQINSERLRFAELIYRRSDIVIIDEADRVQVQLDNIFSPNQILASKGTSAWFNRLSQQVLPKLNQEGRAQLIEKDVEAWCSAHEMAQMAINRVYAMLLQEKVLRSEIEQDYFTAWMILEQLATRLSAAEVNNRHDDTNYQRFMSLFEALIADPMGERVETELSRHAERSVTHSDKNRNRERIIEWIHAQDIPRELDDNEVRLSALLLEFALVVAVLSNRLDHLLRDWKQAELALQLEGTSSIIFHRPPDDYSPVIPASPMGNVLAFQYLVSNDNQPGELRFFRCMGVGRWFLLNFHELFAGDGAAGPHVILFSGTSWAGKSPSYHVQLPVAGILHAPDSEVKAITEDSTFEFHPIYDNDGNPIYVSGKYGNNRLNAMYAMLNYYAKQGGIRGNKASLFERERDSLPQDRQRLLILVGSYDEARYAREYLEDVRPDWKGQIVNLVPDDDEFESTWQGSEDNTLQRGLVHRFAENDDWILIAPLLAVERGHNILNDQNQAAIGAAYFLIHPHPRPDDISFAIQSINQWAVDQHKSSKWAVHTDFPEKDNLLTTGEQFRQAAYDEWRYLLRLPLIYSTLPRNQREAVIWSQLVTIWQVIGRLIRGGSPARVYFCDASFARNTALKAEDSDKSSTSLLVGIIKVLAPYFDDDSHIPEREKVLVKTLYGPFYQALNKMKGLPENV